MQASGWLYLLEQTLSSACLLLSAGLSAGLRQCRPWRMLLLSLMLAVLTMAAQGLSAWLRMALLLPMNILAPLLAWPDAPRSLRLRMMGLSAALSLLLTGALRLLSPLPLPGILLLTSCCAALVWLSRRSARVPPAPRCTAVEVTLGNRRASLTALVDSGNLLRDAITGLPVIVISRRAAARLMALPPEDALLPGMRLMTVRTISGTGLMRILRPDGLRIHLGGAWRAAEALIGLSPDGYEGFQALVPASLLDAAPTELPIPIHSNVTGG